MGGLTGGTLIRWVFLMSKQLIRIALLVTLAVGQGWAQNVHFEQLSIKQGLSQATVTCVLQDRRGFLWFGTADGLNRYNGYSFKTYRSDPEDTSSLSSSLINVLYEDRKGRLWVGTTSAGLNCFDPVTGQVTRYQHRAQDPGSLSEDYVSAICEDRAGALWVGTGTGGLNRLDPATGKFTRYRHQPDNPNSLSSDHAVSVYEDRAGGLWVGTSRHGLNRFDPKTGTFSRYGNARDAAIGLKENSVWAMYEDRQGNFWVGGIGGTLHQFDRRTGQFTRFDNHAASPNAQDGFNVMRAITEDRDGKLWFASLNNGLLRFDPATGAYTRFENQPGNPGSIGDNTVVCVYTDRAGTVWAGSFAAGAQKVDQLRNRFAYYRTQTHPLSSNNISALCAGRTGDLWIGSVDGGVNRLDRRTGKVTVYQHQPGNRNTLSSNSVNSVYEDVRGHIWVGTYTSGLNRLDPATGRVTRYAGTTTDTLDNGDHILITTYEDQKGNFWTLSAAGLSQLDRATGRFIHYPDAAKAALVPGNETGALLEDRTGTFWIGGDAGLARFDRVESTFTPYKSRKKTPVPAVNASVTSLYEDRAGRLWIGTTDGLYVLDHRADQLTHYGKKDGLADQLVKGVHEDARGLIWISTSTGIAKLDPTTGQFRNFDQEDGLLSEEYSANSCQTASGELVLGGVNGLDVFHPDRLRDNPYVPPVVLTDFQVFNQSVPVRRGGAPAWDALLLRQPIEATRELTLPYDANVFSFQYAALDYTRPEKNQYAYRLEGFEKDWVQAGSRRFVTYTNLDPGLYTFRLRGSNNDGVWNPNGQTVRITILPPWWRTGWAYAGYALLGLGALYSFRSYTIRQERLRNDLRLERMESQKLQEIDQLKTSFFTNLSHEFRTPLTLILGPLEQKLAAMTKDHPEAGEFRLMQRNARRLLELINQLLDLSRLDAGRLQLQAQPGEIVGFLRTTASAFETLAQQRGMELQFSSQPAEIKGFFDRDKLEKIMYNLLSNAFKFTPNGGVIGVRVSVEGSTPANGLREAEAQRGHVVIAVEDSGEGILPDQLAHIFDRFYQARHATSYEQEGSGIGLALTRELVKLHGGEIAVSSRRGEGTRFTVKLPLGKAHLRPDQLLDVPMGSRSAVLPNPPVPGVPVREDLPAAPTDQELPLVLVVEDNADMRQYLRMSLGSAYRLEEATDGEEGLERAAQLVPDLVISDVMMPNMDGLAFCRQLKTDQRTSHVPVILLTARAGRESKLSGLETGADDYLTKPFDAEELIVRVRNLIRQRQQLRERFSQEIKLEPGEAALPSAEEQFLQRAVRLVEAKLGDADFDVVAFSREMGMSQSQLYRKLTALTGYNSSEFIRRLRLQRAAALLAAGQGNVTEVSYAVGFNNLSYFAKCFRELYGQSPSEYVAHSAKAE